MNQKTYNGEDLQDDRWHRKREKILNYADHRCQACGIENDPLQVHHSYYREGLSAWEYPDGSLIALCGDCHSRVIHGIGKEQKGDSDRVLPPLLILPPTSENPMIDLYHMLEPFLFDSEPYHNIEGSLTEMIPQILEDHINRVPSSRETCRLVEIFCMNCMDKGIMALANNGRIYRIPTMPG